MNELLMLAATTGVGALAGYFGHVAQAAHTRKHEHRADEIAQTKDLHRRLVELRDQERKPLEVAKSASALQSEAAFLRRAELRKRVTRDLEWVSDLYFLPTGSSAGPREKQNVWIQDALDALAAVARGERLPEHSWEYNTQDFYLQRTTKKMAAGLSGVVSMVSSLRNDPEFEALFQERSEWEARRRAKRGWRRFIPRRRTRSEDAAGQEVDRHPRDESQQNETAQLR